MTTSPLSEIKSKIKKEIRDTFSKIQDNYTNNHCKRVFYLSIKFMSLYEKIYKRKFLSKHIEKDLIISSKTHDIGKVLWPLDSLTKPASFSSNEISKFRNRHPENGARIIYDILSKYYDNLPEEYLTPLFLLTHHHWNHNKQGDYYPINIQDPIINKYAGSTAYCLTCKKSHTSNIKIAYSIMRIADSIDASICNRPHNKTKKWSIILGNISNQSGTIFSPDVTKLIKLKQNAIKIYYRLIFNRFPDPNTDLSKWN